MFISMFDVQYWKSNNIWDKVFKNGASKICGRQPLKITKDMVWLKLTILLQNFERLSSTNFTWPILEYLFPFATLEKYMKSYKSYHGLILLTSVFPRKSMTPVQKNYPPHNTTPIQNQNRLRPLPPRFRGLGAC